MGKVVIPTVTMLGRYGLPAYERAKSYAYVLRGSGPYLVSFSESETRWYTMDGVFIAVDKALCVGTGIAKTQLVGAIDDEGRAHFLDVVVANGRSYRSRHVDDRLDSLRKILILVGDYFGDKISESEVVHRSYVSVFDYIVKIGGAGLFLLRPGNRYAVFCGNTEYGKGNDGEEKQKEK